MRQIGPDRRPRFTPVCTSGHGQATNRGMRLLSSCALLLGLGCADHDQPLVREPEETFQPLVELEDWTAVERDDDPFVDDDAPPEDCVSPGVRVEDDQSWLELDTTQCGFITVAADARFDVAEGQKLKLDVSHFDLNAAEPATAELRLRFDDCEAWENSIAIPSPANVYELEFDSPCQVAQGGQVLFHLHNHGQNTYQLRSISVLR